MSYKTYCLGNASLFGVFLRITTPLTEHFLTNPSFRLPAFAPSHFAGELLQIGQDLHFLVVVVSLDPFLRPRFNFEFTASQSKPL